MITIKSSSLLILFFIVTNLVGCTSLTSKIPLNDAPSPVELSFGKSVKRMIDVQKRLRVKSDPSAGYELQGWEAEKIITDFDRPK